jgi:Ca-activated chloride channel family protein
LNFSDPIWLRGLIALPILALLEWRAVRRAGGALERLVGPRREHALLAQRRPSERAIGAVLRLSALTLLIVAAARPEWGREVVRRGASGSDVVLVMDVSLSMDARDVAPSRISEARREALALIDRLGGSRIGVVAFAGDAVRLCPLTLDRAAARLTVESISSASVSHPGTDLGRALRMALRVLPPTRREEQAIVLWTDGEDLEQGARAAIDDVARGGVRVLAVGVGTAGGDVIPILDSEGRAVDVKHDESGNLVRSRLDEELLRTLARRTHGAYFAANRPGGELPRLLAALSTVARSARGQHLVERPVARFPLFALLATLLLAAERVRARRRRDPRAEETALHSAAGAAAAVMVVALLVACGSRAEAQTAWARGDREFRAGRYAAADSLYTLRLRRGGAAALRVNRATARALRGETDSAIQELAGLAGKDDRSGREAGYNLGTLLGEKRDYPGALRSLRRVLERNPDDRDARWNYEIVARSQDEEKRRSSQHQQPPRPQPSGGGGGGDQDRGGEQPKPAPGTAPATATSPPPPPHPGEGTRMSRTQADQLLSALQELARVEQQRRRPVQAVQEKQGKDW